MCEQTVQSRARSLSASDPIMDPDAKFHAGVHKSYANRDFFHCPKMKDLVFQTMKHPEKKIVIPEGFLEARRVKMLYRLIPLHKLVILINRIILAVCCAFSKSYKGKFETAVMKVSIAYLTFLRDEAKRRAKRVKVNWGRVRTAALKKSYPALRVKQLEKQNSTDLARVNSLKSSQKDFSTRKKILALAQAYQKIPSWQRSIGVGSEKKDQIRELDPKFDFEVLDKMVAAYEAMVTMHQERASEIAELEKVQEARVKVICYHKGNNEEAEKIQKQKEAKAEGLRQKILDTIGEKGHPKIQELMTAFFTRFSCFDLESWDIDSEGKFTLRLHESMRLWVPTIDEEGNEDPVGGLVMIMGNGKNKTVTGRLSKGKIEFTSGFEGYCYYYVPFPFRKNMDIEPKIFSLIYQEAKDKFLFHAGLSQTLSKKREKNLPYLIKNWTERSEVLGNKYKEFLANKRAESLARV